VRAVYIERRLYISVWEETHNFICLLLYFSTLWMRITGYDESVHSSDSKKGPIGEEKKRPHIKKSSN